jgi:hypothetical protein
MTITVEIPKGLLDHVVRAGQDPARAALEAIALEGYRSDRLTETDIGELLGFETLLEVDGFLKEHGAFLPYTDEDLEHDCAVARQVAHRVRIERRADLPGDRPAG